MCYTMSKTWVITYMLNWIPESYAWKQSFIIFNVKTKDSHNVIPTGKFNGILVFFFILNGIIKCSPKWYTVVCIHARVWGYTRPFIISKFEFSYKIMIVTRSSVALVVRYDTRLCIAHICSFIMFSRQK